MNFLSISSFPLDVLVDLLQKCEYRDFIEFFRNLIQEKPKTREGIGPKFVADSLPDRFLWSRFLEVL